MSEKDNKTIKEDREEQDNIAEEESIAKEQEEKNDEENEPKNEESADEGEESKMKEEYDELYDKYVRLFSEFENFRKRSRKEVIESKEQADSAFALLILPVIDDFERAMDTLKKSGNEDVDGIELIYKKLKKILSDKGIKPMDAKGDDFDPEYHEALSQVPAPEKELKGKVVDEIEKGYMLNDKVVRYAKVIVGQ